MSTAFAIVTFLKSQGLTDAEPAGFDALPITAVRSEEEASAGSLSWMSAKRHLQDSSRLAQFPGALLIAPPDAPSGRVAGGFSVACRTPKLAFSKVVDHFFSASTEWPWSADARASDSLVSPSARIAPGVVIGRSCVIGDGVEIGPGTAIAHTTVGAGTHIGANCTIGLPGFGFDKAETGEWFRFPHIGTVEIGANVEIGSNTCIDRGALGATRIGDGAKIDNLVHIAHNVVVGPNALVIANAMLGGSAKIGAGTWIAPSASVMNQVTIGSGVTVGMGAVVTKHVRDGVTVAGVPAKELQPKG